MEPFSKTLILGNRVEEISRLSDYIDEIAEQAAIDSSLIMSLNLALEEAVTNVVLYAYPQGMEGRVEILATVKDDVLTFVVSDEGVAFDPTLKPDADVTLSAEERPIGGLGIFLVKQLMDDVHYERVGNSNVLTMTKNLNGAPVL